MYTHTQLLDLPSDEPQDEGMSVSLDIPPQYHDLNILVLMRFQILTLGPEMSGFILQTHKVIPIQMILTMILTMLILMTILNQRLRDMKLTVKTMTFIVKAGPLHWKTVPLRAVNQSVNFMFLRSHNLLRIGKEI